jgi:biotin transport system substrate-specific component
MPMMGREGIRGSARAVASAGVGERVAAGIIGVLVFAVLTALGAHVRMPLPFTPVPITLQTLFVALAGATLGPVLGPVSQGLYVLAGGLGLPIFAGGVGGWTHLALGPTGGYLLGFLAAAGLTGWMIRCRDARFSWILLSMAGGHMLIYACGILWLALILGVSLERAVSLDALPFLAGDAVKLCVAAGLFWGAARRMRTAFP